MVEAGRRTGGMVKMQARPVQVSATVYACVGESRARQGGGGGGRQGGEGGLQGRRLCVGKRGDS